MKPESDKTGCFTENPDDCDCIRRRRAIRISELVNRNANLREGLAKSKAMALEMIGHLGAADTQSLPTDDQIIMGHVREALHIAREMHSADIRTGL